MRSENIGEYEIEYSGERLDDVDGWAAFVVIYGPSHNPMHRNVIFPHQRVAIDTVFHSEREAEEQAHKAALAMLD